MTINEYQKLAMTTLNPELDKKDVLINGVMGLCGESGDFGEYAKHAPYLSNFEVRKVLPNEYRLFQVADLDGGVYGVCTVGMFGLFSAQVSNGIYVLKNIKKL